MSTTCSSGNTHDARAPTSCLAILQVPESAIARQKTQRLWLRCMRCRASREQTTATGAGLRHSEHRVGTRTHCCRGGSGDEVSSSSGDFLQRSDYDSYEVKAAHMLGALMRPCSKIWRTDPAVGLPSASQKRGGQLGTCRSVPKTPGRGAEGASGLGELETGPRTYRIGGSPNRERRAGGGGGRTEPRNNSPWDIPLWWGPDLAR